MNIKSLVKKHFWKFIWERRGKKDDLSARGFSGGSYVELDNIVKHVIAWLEFDSNDTVLDIGCGLGYIDQSIAPLVKEIVGVDSSQTLASRAQAVLSEYSNIQILYAEAANIPEPDNKFSKIICYSVIHYFPSENYFESFLKEIKRLLRDGGKALIGDIPKKGVLDFGFLDRFNIFQKIYMSVITVITGSILQKRYSKAKLIRLANELGLSAKIITQPSCLPFHSSRFDLMVTTMNHD